MALARSLAIFGGFLFGVFASIMAIGFINLSGMEIDFQFSRFHEFAFRSLYGLIFSPNLTFALALVAGIGGGFAVSRLHRTGRVRWAWGIGGGGYASLLLFVYIGWAIYRVFGGYADLD